MVLAPLVRKDRQHRHRCAPSTCRSRTGSFDNIATMTALLLALASSASYWASDFLASRVTKHLSPVLLVLYSQAAQGLVLLVIVLAVRQPFTPVGLSWGAAAGTLIAIGLLGYYQALATGPTAVVAPLAASGVVVPVLVDPCLGRVSGGAYDGRRARRRCRHRDHDARHQLRAERRARATVPGSDAAVSRAVAWDRPPAEGHPPGAPHGHAVRDLLPRRRSRQRGRWRRGTLGGPRHPARGAADHIADGPGGRRVAGPAC